MGIGFVKFFKKKPSIFAIGMHLDKYWIAHFLIDQQSNDDDGDYVCGGGDNIRHAWNGFGGDGIAEACKLRNNKSSCVTLIFAQYLLIVIVFIIPIISYISYQHYQLQASEKRATEGRDTYLPS